VPDHRLGDAFAASQAGGDELPGVAAVALRARGADRFAAVAAGLAQQPVWLAVGRPDLPPAATGFADLDVAAQADGPLAVSGGAQLRLKARVVRTRDSLEDAVQQPARQ